MVGALNCGKSLQVGGALTRKYKIINASFVSGVLMLQSKNLLNLVHCKKMMPAATLKRCSRFDGKPVPHNKRSSCFKYKLYQVECTLYKSLTNNVYVY